MSFIQRIVCYFWINYFFLSYLALYNQERYGRRDENKNLFFFVPLFQPFKIKNIIKRPLPIFVSHFFEFGERLATDALARAPVGVIEFGPGADHPGVNAEEGKLAEMFLRHRFKNMDDRGVAGETDFDRGVIGVLAGLAVVGLEERSHAAFGYDVGYFEPVIQQHADRQLAAAAALGFGGGGRGRQGGGLRDMTPEANQGHSWTEARALIEPATVNGPFGTAALVAGAITFFKADTEIRIADEGRTVRPKACFMDMTLTYPVLPRFIATNT